MAIFNEILVGRFNKSLQKVFGIKSKPPVRQLSGEVVPVHSLGAGVEMRYLEQWNRYSASATIAANAANITQFRMTNDVGSNVLGVIEKLVISLTVAGEADLVLVNFQSPVSGHLPNLTPLVPSQAMDARNGNAQNPNPSGNIIVSQANTTNTINPIAMAGRYVFQANIPADLILDEDHQWTLLPQALFQVQIVAANVGMTFWVVWRERYLEESERI